MTSGQYLGFAFGEDSTKQEKQQRFEKLYPGETFEDIFEKNPNELMKKLFPPKCAVCGSKRDLKSCSACKVVHYCSREHQRDHWMVHKANCKILQMKLDVLFMQFSQLRTSDNKLKRTGFYFPISNRPLKTFTPVSSWEQFHGIRPLPEVPNKETVDLESFERCYTDMLSFSMTLYYCLVRLELITKVISIHIIGAEEGVETIFPLHRFQELENFLPQVEWFDIKMIGPAMHPWRYR